MLVRSVFVCVFALLFVGCGSSHDPDDAGADTGLDDAGTDDAGTAEHPLTPRWRALTALFNQNGCQCEVEAGRSPSVETCLETAEDFTMKIVCLNDEFGRATEAEIAAYECLTDGLEMSQACSAEMGCGESAERTCGAIEDRELGRCEDIFTDEGRDPFGTCGI